MLKVPDSAAVQLTPGPWQVTYGYSIHLALLIDFLFSSRRRHTSFDCDWSSDVCSSDLGRPPSPDPDRRGAGRSVHRLPRHPAGAPDPRLRRDRRPRARPPGGAVLPRLLRQLLLPAFVRLLRRRVADGLPPAQQDRRVQAQPGAAEAAGPAAPPGLAGSPDHDPGRQRVLPLEADAVVRFPRDRLRPGAGPQPGPPAAGRRLDRPGGASVPAVGPAAAGLRLLRLRGLELGPAAARDRQGRAHR